MQIPYFTVSGIQVQHLPCPNLQSACDCHMSCLHTVCKSNLYLHVKSHRGDSISLPLQVRYLKVSGELHPALFVDAC